MDSDSPSHSRWSGDARKCSRCPRYGPARTLLFLLRILNSVIARPVVGGLASTLITQFHPGVFLTPAYSSKLEELLKRARPRFAITHDLEFRNCFGAVANYVGGNIFAPCGKFGLALRHPPQAPTELFDESDVSPLKYFEKAHVKKQYAVIPERIINDRARFGRCSWTKVTNSHCPYLLRSSLPMGDLPSTI